MILQTKADYRNRLSYTTGLEKMFFQDSKQSQRLTFPPLAAVKDEMRCKSTWHHAESDGYKLLL